MVILWLKNGKNQEIWQNRIKCSIKPFERNFFLVEVMKSLKATFLNKNVANFHQKMPFSIFFLVKLSEIDPISPKNTKNQLSLKNHEENTKINQFSQFGLKTSLDGDISQNWTDFTEKWPKINKMKSLHLQCRFIKIANFDKMGKSFILTRTRTRHLNDFLVWNCNFFLIGLIS